MQNVVRRPTPVLFQLSVRLLQALRQALVATLHADGVRTPSALKNGWDPIGQSLPLIQMALVYIRHGRYQMERAEQPSGMAKATLIVLGGLAILAVALFAALRASAGKISTQMNADY